MKKRVLSILAVFVIFSVIFCQSVFAAGELTLVSAFPKDGGTGYQTSNQMARLVFSEKVSARDNEGKFVVLNPDGKKEKIRVLEQKDDPNRINLLFESELQQNADYKIIIDGSFVDVNGNTLGEDITIAFKTKNMKTESLVTTGLMVMMFVVIIVMTVREQAKQQRQDTDSKEKKVNPYKEARKEAEKIVNQRKKEREQKMAEYQKSQQGNSQNKGQAQNKGQNQKKKK